jgi:hypothetical protein
VSDYAAMVAWISLGLGLVVTLVAVVLLTLVLRTARAIDAGAKQIWTAGKLVARNTVHIPALLQTNQVVADIEEEANGILMAAQRILTHAQGCPGCPACLVEQSGRS